MTARVVSDPTSRKHTKTVSPNEYYDGGLDAERRMEGEGTYVWGDRTNWLGQGGVVYSGSWSANHMHGFGVEIDEDGSYAGPFVHDSRSGRMACHLHADGSIYVGRMDTDVPDAETGLTVTPEGPLVYRGRTLISAPETSAAAAEVGGGKASGGHVVKGETPPAPPVPAAAATSTPPPPLPPHHTVVFEGGGYYDGALNAAGREHGDGVQVWQGRGVQNWLGQPWCAYIGKWADGAWHGFGVHIGRHGTFVGLFKKGRRQGEGVFFFKSGAVYAGEFLADQPAGKGRQVEPDGRILLMGKRNHLET